MDPVSAIGVAATAIAFLDFSLETLSRCRELRDSTTNVLPENLDIERRAKTIRRLTKDLKASCSISSTAEKRIRELGGKCASLAEELQELLEKIKPNGKSISQVLKSVLRNIRDRRTIEKLETTLHSYQNLLGTTILVDLRQRVDLLAVQHTEAFSLWHKDYQNIVMKLASSEENNIARHAKAYNDINLRIKESEEVIIKKVAQEHEHTRARTNDAYWEMQEQLSTKTKNEAFLKNLFFSDYKTRQEQVEEAYKNTFRWIFNDRPEAHSPWPNFARWLREEGGVFWIYGKPGSGKSTLMSFILDEEQLQTELRCWGQDQEILCLSFFFWRPGTLLQRSILGVLRSLLYQLLEADRIFLGEIRVFVMQGSENMTTWTEKGLRRALLKALQTTKRKICIFLDGLDEFDGDTEMLLDFCAECSRLTHVKLCVSSRPEVPLKRRLHDYRSLRLQDLTHEDMVKYVEGRLQKLKSMESLKEKIIARSDGVFLWTALVTGSLLQGYNSYDDENLLLQRLDTFPQGLYPLYEHMINSIDTLYQETARVYLLMTHLTVREVLPMPALTVAGLTLSLDDTLQTGDDLEDKSALTFLRRCRITNERIQIYCRGLLEVRLQGPKSVLGFESDDDSQSSETSAEDHLATFDKAEVLFSHRTAYEFVFKSDIGQNFMADSTCTEQGLEVAFLEGLLRSFRLLPKLLSPLSTQKQCVHKKFPAVLKAASSIQHFRIPRDRLISELYHYLAIQDIGPYTELVFWLRHQNPSGDLKAGFLAYCAEVETWEFFEYIRSQIKAEAMPSDSLSDMALLKARLPKPGYPNLRRDYSRVELANLLLTCVNMELPANSGATVQLLNSRLADLFYICKAGSV